MRDGCQTVTTKMGIPFGPVANNTPSVSAIIDTLGAEFVHAYIMTGSLGDTDATFTVSVESGAAANLSDAAPVVDAQLTSQTEGIAPEVAASFTFAADNNVRKIEYLPGLRYVRITITPAGNTVDAFFGLLYILGSPQQASVVQPPL